MTDLPAPLTPPDCDLRGMAFMPVDIVRLFDSDLYALATGDEFKAAFTLWGRSFLQVPAASLPDDGRILAHLSGAGSRWKKVKALALHGWVKCSDGRLYHPVVAEKALEAMGRRQEHQETEGTKAERQKRWRERQREMSQRLREMGIVPPQGASLATLERLLRDAAVDGNVDAVDGNVDAYGDAAEMRKTGTGTGTGTGTNNLPAQRSTTSPPTLNEVMDACFGAIGDPDRRRAASSTALLNMAPILRFLDAGYSLDRIVGVIRSVRKVPKSLGSWAYFASAIEEELGKPPPAPPKSNGTNGHHKPIDWDSRERLVATRQAPLIDWGDPFSWPEAERKRPGFAWWFEANGGAP